jgi:hypothetical protein
MAPQENLRRGAHPSTLKLLLVAVALLACTQLLLLALTSLRQTFYLPYLAPHYFAIWIVSTAVMVLLLISASAACGLLLRSVNRLKGLSTAIIAAAALLLVAISCPWWGDLALGVGQSETVAQMKLGGLVYRLDYTAPGDPPFPGFYIYECWPSPEFCRQAATIIDVQVYRPFPPLQLIPTNGGFAVVVGGSPIALFTNGVLTCATPTGPPFCVTSTRSTSRP